MRRRFRQKAAREQAARSFEIQDGLRLLPELIVRQWQAPLAAALGEALERAIVARLAADPATLQAIVTCLLGQLAHRSKITISVHPACLAELETIALTHGMDGGIAGRLAVQGDPQIRFGDFVFQCGEGKVLTDWRAALHRDVGKIVERSAAEIIAQPIVRQHAAS